MKEETPALTLPSPSPAAEQVEPSKDTATASVAGAASLPSADVPRSGALPGWALLLAVIALGGAGVAGWQAWSVRGEADGLRAELARRLTDSDLQVSEVKALARQQQDVIASLQGKLAVVESKMEAAEGQAAALESLYQQFSRSQDDGVIAEVDQAVTLAAQQLQLAGNVEGALVALQSAEARLAVHDRGQLAPLRRALATDIEHLRRLAVVDVSGIALRLERLLDRVDVLPLTFAGEVEAVQPEVSTPLVTEGGSKVLDFAAQLALDVWHDLRSLIRVERLQQGAEPVLLAPSQSTYLRENLRIRLLTARLALLAGDGRSYAVDLAEARTWIERFFDSRDEGVQLALTELKALEAMPVKVERHDLAASLSALRLFQSRGGREPQVEPPEARPSDARPEAGGARGATVNPGS